jgi:hypothetical protein
MLPWVWWRGSPQINTVLFCTLLGALNVGLVYGLLADLRHHGWTQLERVDNLWPTLLLGLGSVHWYMATTGSVWFVAQICTVTFALLAVWLTIRNGSPWLAGFALALAMLARPTIILTWPLLLGAAVMRQRNPADERPAGHWTMDWRASLRWALGKRTTWPMRLLILMGVLVNAGAVVWWHW